MHSPQYPKVKGSSLEVTLDTGIENMPEKTEILGFLLESFGPKFCGSFKRAASVAVWLVM